MLKSKPCSQCGSIYHSAWWHTRQPLERKVRMKQVGKETQRYNEFRDEIARPYLIDKFGEKCAICKREDLPLDIDHILKRGSNPQLKYDLKNLQLLCRRCHMIKDGGMKHKGE